MSADVALEDLTNTGYRVRMSRYLDKLDGLPEEKRRQIFAVIDAMLKN